MVQDQLLKTYIFDGINRNVLEFCIYLYHRKSVVVFFFKSLPIHRIRDKTRMTLPSRIGFALRIKFNIILIVIERKMNLIKCY